jgi:hypothetical protein
MIDFVKIKVLNPDIPRIRNNLRLEWFQRTSERTGEVKEYTSTYNDLNFEIKNDKHLNISGSLHKFWNNLHGRGEQNYNDFNFADLVSVIIEFYKMFDLVPGSCILENLEFGVNVSPTIPANEILRSVINHKGKPFTNEYTDNKRFRECERQRYIVKIYNKGLQYNQPGNILRFENKTIKMAHIKETGITTLQDLLDIRKIERLGVILFDNFNELLFYDYTIPEAVLRHSKRLILTQGQSPAYWINLKETNPNNYYKKLHRFKELAKKHGTRDIQEMVGSLISLKWNNLLMTDSETLQKLTDPANTDITGINHSDKGLKPVTFTEQDQSTDPIPGEIIPGAEIQGAESPRRYCLSCGKDISHQRANSKFCSAKYVGYVQAHQCRNIDSNPRNRMKYMIEREKKILTLFDTTPFYILRKTWTSAYPV